MRPNLLKVEDLSLWFIRGSEKYRVLNSFSLEVKRGEVYSLVGASGSGKSVFLKSILRLLPNSAIIDGRILFDGVDLTELPESRLNLIRGKRISIVFQDPMSSLNPTMKVGEQVAEVLNTSKLPDKRDIRRKVVEMFEEVGLKDPEMVYEMYPHQLSGGMRQRVMIAMALIGNPELMLLDEPTTALDVTVQAGILELIKREITTKGISSIFVTHDFSVVYTIADRVGVIFRGVLVEEAKKDEIFKNPLHPYTIALMEAIPKPVKGKFNLRFGEIPSMGGMGYKGCPFYDYCDIRVEECRFNIPQMIDLGEDHRVRCFSLNYGRG